MSAPMSLAVFLMGAIAMASFVAALFFLRFWRGTRDRLFLIFAMAFFLLGLTRLTLALVSPRQEEHTYVYWVRLTAFILIVFAIIDKNRPRQTGRAA